ncbi:MAG: 1-acyl-sn-glycerol-3-phosphate acyltransferase, partial [Deltaproteobacteria bacterium]|nr:1-acyl-sn-glycerol-3-phosphate acyltransferase [Deltaproteobacteria bacterium]
AMPLVGTFYNRLGSVVASLANARRLLEHGDVVGIFPEGVAGVSKGIAHRYELQPFHTGFVRLAIELRVPVVPVVVVGAEETYPVIAKVQALGRLRELLNIPYVPVTPFFPLLGRWRNASRSFEVEKSKGRKGRISSTHDPSTF